MMQLRFRGPEGETTLRWQEDRLSIGGDVEGVRRVEIAGWPPEARMEILRAGTRYVIFDTGPQAFLRVDGRPERRAELSGQRRLSIGPLELEILETRCDDPPEPAPRDALVCYSPSTGSFRTLESRDLRLRVQSGRDAGLEVLIGGQGAVLGRDPGCDLALTDPKVSARHARVLRGGDEWILKDLDSRNGTFLGDRRIRSEVLAEGDEIRLGGTRLRLVPIMEDAAPVGDVATTAADELLIFRVPQVLAHEIRNYLSVVGLSCEHLVRSTRKEGGRVPTALRNIDRARGQIEHLLGLLRLASSDPRLEEHDLSAVITEQLAMLEPELRRRGIQLEMDLQRPLPVRLDPRQIGQVLLNLLRNAMEAAGEGGRLTVRSELRVDQVWFTVADDGPGLPPEERERAFEPFVTTKAEGTGLGLYVSREIMRRHGGRLEMEEAPEGGAMVVGCLPSRGG